MTWAELRSLFYSITGDDEASPQIFSATMLAGYADTVLRRMVEHAAVLESRTVIFVETNVATYDLPELCRRVFRATYDDEKLYPITKKELRLHDEGWFERTGVPRFYYLDELNSQIGLFVKPDASSIYSEAEGVDHGFIVDAGPGTEIEGPLYGFIVDISDATPLGPPEGAVYDVLEGKALEVFYQADPRSVAAVGAVQLPGWAMYGLLWGALSEAYRAGTRLQDYQTSATYGVMHSHAVKRLVNRAAGKLPRVWVTTGHRPAARIAAAVRLPQHIEES